MIFTVGIWMDLKTKGDTEASLQMLQVYEGQFRADDVSWAKVVDAPDWRDAYKQAIIMLKAGEKSDNLEMIPIKPKKEQNLTPIVETETDNTGRKVA